MSDVQTQPRPKTLNFITGNANKLAEVRAILADVSGVQMQSRDVPGLSEIQGTIEEVAIDKASKAAAMVNGPVLTEDTALEFQALKGLPGPYIKYFLQALGHEGLNNMLAAYEDKTAFAVCTFAYCAGPDHEPILFQGRTQGKIVPARGPGIFGWDAVFEYEGQTYAEMDKTEKVGDITLPPNILPHSPAGPTFCRSSVNLALALPHVNPPLSKLLTPRQPLTEFPPTE
ncbi:Ham1 family protein [Exophiala aquamarina CBS 119918]|uniref:Inosine triphosphate pyrophosphatase n=1 Tax=Exophiala aquamarina CBS 119918 TaxID=1182545 RepID=A0A072PP39_9EURO|nr:Ham1 family protein [Exophiala aquamarina CBS 119918]KEF61656.1 Ham1 family protein [Exophiala aquamarina CBS 119918]